MCIRDSLRAQVLQAESTRVGEEGSKVQTPEQRGRPDLQRPARERGSRDPGDVLSARSGREASRAGARQVRRCRIRWKAREAKRADDAVTAARAELSVITLPCTPHPSSCTSIDIERFIHPLYATVKGKRRLFIFPIYIYIFTALTPIGRSWTASP